MKKTYKVKKELTIQKTYRKWEDYQVGDMVLGELVGYHKDRYGKDCPIIKVEEAFFKDKKVGQSLIGKNLVLNSNGMLDKALKNGGVQIGDVIQVEYQGKNMMEKGPYKGKEAHAVGVQVMAEDDSDFEEEDEAL